MAERPKPIPMFAGPTSRSLGDEFAVVAERIAPGLLTNHKRTFEAVPMETAFGPEKLTADIPNLASDKLEHLDERGLAKVGVEVKAGDILIGQVSPLSGLMSPEEKLLKAIFGEAAGDVRDTSVRMPPWLSGTVTEAVVLPGKSESEVARARVVVRWERPLEVGDVIRVGDRTATVCAIEAIDRDVEIGGVGVSGAIEVVTHARDVIHARSIGPYSLVTQQPLSGREEFGGQAIGPRQLSALVRGGALWTAGELLTIKSDSVIGRVRCYESVVKGENPDLYPEPEPDPDPEPEPKKPDGKPDIKDIFSFFERPKRPKVETAEVIGAHIRALGLDFDVDHAPVRLTAMSPAKIRELSHGQIRKPETINYQTHKPEADGLMCQKVFGPTLDYECACGKYKRMKHRGVVCEKCGVEVIQSKVRRERFGHIDLARPVAHPWFEGETLECIPVLPPDLRPLVPLAGGRFATSDLNDLYRRVINRTNRAARLLELDAPEQIVGNELEVLAAEVARLFANETHDKPATGTGERPLRSLAGVLGDWAPKALAKRTDYSGTAPLVANASVGAKACRVSVELAVELFTPWIYGWLEQKGYATTIKSAKRMVKQQEPAALEALEAVSARYPALLIRGDDVVCRAVELWDHPAIAVDPRTADELGAGAVQIHLPITEKARAECRALADRPETASFEPSGWIGALLAGGDPIETLCGAVKSGDGDRLSDPMVRLALGLAPS